MSEEREVTIADLEYMFRLTERAQDKAICDGHLVLLPGGTGLILALVDHGDLDVTHVEEETQTNEEA